VIPKIIVEASRNGSNPTNLECTRPELTSALPFQEDGSINNVGNEKLDADTAYIKLDELKILALECSDALMIRSNSEEMLLRTESDSDSFDLILTPN